MGQSGESYNCERPCQCCNEKHDCKLIVLTGGPGAGKTAVLEAARKMLCEHIAILPEAAGIVFGGGFWRLDSLTSRLASQRAIFHIQSEMESLVISENKWGIGLCDRGTLDGLAYWLESEEKFWETFSTSKLKEYERYQAVIHLRTPSLEKGYNHQNPMRVESSEQAADIDNKIKKAWKDHPNYFEIQSKDSFLEKVDETFQIIKKFMPECCKQHFDISKEK